HAPDLGSRLSADAGLSGGCIQSRKVQRCDDTETDTRVDAGACRVLGVRCLVVVPLLKESETAGSWEVFSPHANVCSDGDDKTLSALSEQIVETMIRADEEEKEPETAVIQAKLEVNETIAPPRRDPWITVLWILIVGVALLLGWMVGHRGLSGIVG